MMNIRKKPQVNNRPPSATFDMYQQPQQQQQPDMFNANNQMFYDQQRQQSTPQQAYNTPTPVNHQQNFYDPMGQNFSHQQAPHPQLNQQQQQTPFGGNMQQSQQFGGNFTPQQPFQNPQMFYPNNNGTNPAMNLLNDPMAAMAVKYSSQLADQGKAYVAQNVDRWFSISNLKYYFAVDTSYVGKKLFLLLFPYFNRDWSVKYDQNVAVPPKLDKNAPDMYIPVMAYVTYILIVGIALGTREKFTPEILGISASSALAWFLTEVFVISIVIKVLAVRSFLKTYDVMAFCGYKYFGMIFCIIAGLLISPTAYAAMLLYMSASIFYFMVSRKFLINYSRKRNKKNAFRIDDEN